MKYLTTIVLTNKQLRVLEDALDLYTRLGIGQLEIVGEKLAKLFPDRKFNYWDLRTQMFDKLKQELFGFPPGASSGIGNTSDDASIGYDLQKVIQKIIATKENHNKSSVWHDGPLLHLGSEPIAKAEILDKYPKEQIEEEMDEVNQMKAEMKANED